MMSMAGIAILTMIAGALSLALGPESASGIGFVFPASIAALIGAVIFYFINRCRSGIAASILFLLFLTMSLALADSPSELANGAACSFSPSPSLWSVCCSARLPVLPFTAPCTNNRTEAAKKQGRADDFGSIIYAVLCRSLYQSNWSCSR